MKRITSLALSAALLASLSTPVLAAPAISVDAAPTAAVLEEENSLWELPQADTPDMSNTVWSFAGGYIDGGEIYFKTDDDDLFRDSVEYFPASGYDIEWITYDLHENEPAWNIRTEHEGMFTEMGIKIKALIARKKPGADSVTWVDPKVLKRMAREAAAAEAAAQEGEGNV